MFVDRGFHPDPQKPYFSIGICLLAPVRHGKASEAKAEGEEKQESPAEPMEEAKDDAAIDEDSLLVLTSEKRRGVYECDYCHSDISQQPRIRCAVCNDFDLCLDCFATSDHEAMIARIKAATQTQTELNKDGIGSTAIVVSSAAALGSLKTSGLLKGLSRFRPRTYT